MFDYLNDYCEYTQKFKHNHNLVILNSELIIVSIINLDFFKRYNSGFRVGARLFDCLSHLPLITKKYQIYNELISSKKVQGYFISQNIGDESIHVIDRVYLSPILNPDGVLEGIELEAIGMDGLPLINIIDSIEDYELHLPNFTKREHEILILKTLGKTNLEISKILNKIYDQSISDKTVANIIYNQIYRKLNVGNKTDLIKAARQRGFDRFLPKSLIDTDQLVVFSPVLS